MKNIFFIILFLSFAFCFGQDTTAPKEETKLVKENTTDVKTETEYNQIFNSVDIHALPPGGMNAFRKYVGQSFRLPEVNTSTIGKVITKFTVCNDGSICDIQILNESPANIGLGEEVKRVLNLSGNWKPALKNDEAVSSYYTLPISLQITPIDKVVQPNNQQRSIPKKD